METGEVLRDMRSCKGLLRAVQAAGQSTETKRQKLDAGAEVSCGTHRGGRGAAPSGRGW